MSNILAVFVPDSLDFRKSEVLSELGLTDGVEVSNVSFSLDEHADSPLTISMVLEGIHELPLLMQKVKDQTEISAEINFYDRSRLQQDVPSQKNKADMAIFMRIASGHWHAVSASFSAKAHDSGVVVELVLASNNGMADSFIVDSKGANIPHHSLRWGRGSQPSH